MSVSEYREKFPEKNYIWEIPWVESPDGSGCWHNRRGKKFFQVYRGVMLRCEDPECKSPDELHFVIPGNLVKNMDDGKYRCLSCASRNVKRKQISSGDWSQPSKDWNKETRIKYAKERTSRLREEGYYTSESRRQALIKGFETAKRNGTFMRSRMELQIEDRFGGIHWFEGHYELDCYWPDLGLGVEVDDPSHYETDNPGEKQKRIGYHKAKDEYFKSLGITVLHLTFNHGDWEARVANFLDGCYMGPLIDLDDPTYGDIIYDFEN